VEIGIIDNQEDSIVFNLSAIDRGLFRSMSLKKEMDEVKKNQSTSKDDIFTKPDPSKTTGMKNGSYDKLNDQGYIPEETVINNGDIIIGKVSPIQPIGNSNKEFKDSSTIYSSLAEGVIDKVYTNIFTADGYEARKVRIRSERTPSIGDKFSSRNGQKGTLGITLRGSDMPFTKNGLVPDLIINPNCIPSRMTASQLIETIVGKVSAIRGHEGDATPFNGIDVESIRDDLEKLGYHRDGTEYLYNGMTGQKLKSQIFIGPTYYYRLKHMTQDKLHSRARGPRSLLTRSAPEGRARQGGLRLG
jgi:DNA-directed RNA polymerase II subunit RPB2